MKKFNELQDNDKIYVLDLRENKLNVGTIKYIAHSHGYTIVYFQEFIPTLMFIDGYMYTINYNNAIYSTNIQSLLNAINKHENI